MQPWPDAALGFRGWRRTSGSHFRQRRLRALKSRSNGKTDIPSRMPAPEFQAPAANVIFLPKRRAALDLALGARQFWRMAGLSLDLPLDAHARMTGVGREGPVAATEVTASGEASITNTTHALIVAARHWGIRRPPFAYDGCEFTVP